MNTPLQTICLTPPPNEINYLSPMLDCGEAGGTWHRLIIHAIPGARLKVRIYISDYARIPPKPCLEFDNPTDILLHTVTGRYLWCRLESNGEAADSVMISYPAYSLTEYLPEIYQSQPINENFADHFLSIFGSLYDDLEHEIDKSPDLYDIDICPQDFAEWLGGWLSIEDMELWPADRIRELVRKTPELYKRRGTISGISMLLSLYAEADFFFIETYHAQRYYETSPTLKGLYGDDRFMLLVLVSGRLGEREENTLAHLLTKSIPAYARARLQPLRPLLILNHYSYLGVNSVLSGISSAGLDGRSALNYSAFGGNRP